jgi:acyl phosphate:glycerol-3-phosphate acyltransferase
MERILCLGIGYLFGLLQTSYIIGKVKGIDIRNHGSGNAGTTNALRVLGTKAGLLVFLGDTIKCILAILVIRFMYGNSNPNMIYLYALYAGTGAILGHNFPFYLKFKGGKGIAATAGLIIAFHPVFLPVGHIPFFWRLFNNSLCFLRFTTCVCRIYDTNDYCRRTGSFSYFKKYIN